MKAMSTRPHVTGKWSKVNKVDLTFGNCGKISQTYERLLKLKQSWAQLHTLQHTCCNFSVSCIYIFAEDIPKLHKVSHTSRNVSPGYHSCRK